MPMLNVHMMRRQMQSNVFARPDIPILLQHRMSFAKVITAGDDGERTSRLKLDKSIFADSCQVNNGGCDVNAICSHSPDTYGCECTCKTGYTNTGSPSNIVCTGEEVNEINVMYYMLTFIHHQIFVDSCLIDNGGCDAYAICSHSNATNAVICTCKTGFTNTGTGSNVTCTGTSSIGVEEEITRTRLMLWS